jgi:hypothetical protein
MAIIAGSWRLQVFSTGLLLPLINILSSFAMSPPSHSADMRSEAESRFFDRLPRTNQLPFHEQICRYLRSFLQILTIWSHRKQPFCPQAVWRRVFQPLPASICGGMPSFALKSSEGLTIQQIWSSSGWLFFSSPPSTCSRHLQTLWSRYPAIDWSDPPTVETPLSSSKWDIFETSSALRERLRSP